MPFKLRSFSTRLSLYIVSAVLLFFIVSFLLYFNLASKAIKNEVFQKSRSQLQFVIKNVDSILEGVELSVKTSAYYVNSSIDNPAEFENILRNMIESNPSIYGGTVALEPNFYKKYGTYYMLYGYRDSVGCEIKFSQEGNEEYDYFTLDWYQIPKLLGKNYWSEPYFDEVVMTTYTHLLYDKDSVCIGSISADLELGWLTEMVLENKPYEDSYAFMLSRNAYYLVHPNSERILNETFFTATDYMLDPEVKKMGLDMISGLSGSRVYDRDGEISYAFYKPISRIGWSVGTVTSERVIMEQFDEMAHATLIIAICGVLFIFIFTVLIIRTLSKPLELFSRSASDIANGNFDTELPHIRAKDEMMELRNAFVNMQVSLKKYIVELKSTTAERERIESELAIANAIQMGMLPKVFPPFPNHAMIDLYAKLTPAKEVGGDLYDFFIQDEKLFFAVGDASGKGVPASLLMAVTISLFRTIAAHTQEPSEILESLNESISDSNEANMFITLFVGVLDLKTGTLNYANAGHNPPILISPAGEVEFIPVDPNLALGIFSGIKFSTQTIKIEFNSAIFAYSDGLTEAENSEKELYSEEKLIAQIKSEDFKTHSVKDVIEHIDESVKAFVKENEQSDDLTMLMLSYKSK